MATDILTQLHPISQGVAAAVIFAATFFAFVRLDPDNPEPFDPMKFATTVALGGVIGGLFAAAGIAPNYNNIAWTLTQYGGVIMLTEKAGKALLNGNKRLAKASTHRAIEEAIGTTIAMGRSSEDLEREVKRGTDEYEETSQSKRREDWDRRYPDEDTAAQLDESDDLEPHDDSEEDALPPA